MLQYRRPSWQISEPVEFCLVTINSKTKLQQKRSAMDKNKKLKPEKDKEENKSKKKKKKDKELDEELEQTFPASDPPSHSRPGNN